ncbi:DUF4178 domain-containing protein [Streptomyces sp. RFCAC02]|uniref:DUF4178 domain-containing protein n=1 Tax=Streptomyces sp. RFCAC02 TaxID=2499143 RepID=UPI0019CFEE98|nr:DUF4178 domain-containing protein [Streptomyces sp. RFCAC02]
MGLALAIVGIVALAAAIVVAVRAARRASARRTPPPPAPADPFAPGRDTGGDPRTLKAGDLVEYLGEQLFVRGSLRLKEGGYTWSEHFVDAMSGADGSDGRRRWLSVEEDPDLEVTLWTGRPDDGLVPSAPTLTVDGVTYRRTEHGTAAFRTEGTTGLGATGRVEYADYEGPNGRSLSFERFPGAGGEPGDWESSLGERVPAGTLTIYPGGAA